MAKYPNEPVYSSARFHRASCRNVEPRGTVLRRESQICFPIIRMGVGHGFRAKSQWIGEVVIDPPWSMPVVEERISGDVFPISLG